MEILLSANDTNMLPVSASTQSIGKYIGQYMSVKCLSIWNSSPIAPLYDNPVCIYVVDISWNGKCYVYVIEYTHMLLITI